MVKRMLPFAMSMAFMFSIVWGNSMEVKAEGEKTRNTPDSGSEECVHDNWTGTYTPNNDGASHKYTVQCNECPFSIIVDKEICQYDNNEYCVWCNQKRNSYLCVHEKCNNEALSHSVCDECYIIEQQKYEKIDDKVHYIIYSCSNEECKSETRRKQEAHYIVNGYCECGYFDSSFTNDNNKPTEPTKSSAPRISEEEAYLKKAAERESKMKKEVKTANGNSVKTEIAGVYEVFSLNGTAVTTSKEDVKKAIGLTEDEIKAGTNASIYMTDDVKAADRETLKDAASSKGKKVLNMVISDMYSITKDGVITKLHNSKEPVSLMFGLPKDAVKGDRNYSVICVARDGSVVELEDTDKDAGTVTIKTTVFGKYAIVY